MYKNIFIKIFKIIFKIIWEYFCVHFSRWRFGIFPFLTGTKNIWSCLFGLVCAVGLFWFPHVVRNLICANAGHYFFKWRSLFFNFWFLSRWAGNTHTGGFWAAGQRDQLVIFIQSVQYQHTHSIHERRAVCVVSASCMMTSMRVEMHVNICMCVTRVQTSRTPGSPERVGARPSTARGMVAVWSSKF